jgi:two-component system sensor histidine kinase FlrB
MSYSAVFSAQDVINHLPLALVVINTKGLVCFANAQAIDKIGVSVNLQWADFVAKNFTVSERNQTEIFLQNGHAFYCELSQTSDKKFQIITFHDQSIPRKNQKTYFENAKLKEMGELTAIILHQIKTPLSSAILYASHILLDLDKQDMAQVRKKIEHINTALKKIQNQSKRIFSFMKITKNQSDYIDLSLLLDRVFLMVEPLLNEKKIHLKWYGLIQEKNIWIDVPEDQFESLMINLIENAMDASKIESEIKIFIKNDFDLQIMVMDQGDQIPIEIEKEMFNPFFSTKMHGTGLGLYIVKQTLHALGMSLSYQNNPKAFVVNVPMAKVQIEKKEERLWNQVS